MKFGSIVNHLGKRGFVTRKRWEGKSVLVFSMDNLLHVQSDLIHGKENMLYTLCLADIKATDWIKLPFFWNGREDDFIPFRT